MKRALILATLVLLIAPRMTNADPIKTEVVQKDGKWVCVFSQETPGR